MAKKNIEHEDPSIPDLIHQAEFREVMDSSFTLYAFKVLEDRAIPDARDGLKPSQRRILYAMDQLGLSPTKKHMKCAKIVGECMGNFHPHGDISLYGTLVGMAQPWSMRTPLIDSQGNFGSIDGDSAAAQRYTEARLSYAGASLLEDLSPRVVKYKRNYDDSRDEPTILPGKLPNLLANGCSGIAVGYATNIPPHNLIELASVFEAFINNPNLTPHEVLKIMPGPDFPSGGKLLGQQSVLEYYTTGRGSLKLEGIYDIEENSKGNSKIIVTQFPEGGAPEKFRNEVKELVEKGKISGLSDIANYSSNKIGTKVVVEVGRNGNPKVILNQLLSHTCLRTSYSVNSTILVDGKLHDKAPITVLIKAFIDHREEVLTNKFKAELSDALERIEVLDGLISVANNIDEAIRIIRGSENPEAAMQNLIAAKIVNTERQAKAVLAITLAKLTKLEHNALVDEKKKKEDRVVYLNKILGDRKEILSIIIQEQKDLAQKLGNPRRTAIGGEVTHITNADLIPVEDVVVCITTDDCIKRVALSEYRKQNRGGMGVTSGNTNESLFMQHMFSASTHDDLLCFTDTGRAFAIKVYDLPEASRTAKGRAIINFVNLKDEEKICAYLPVKGLGKQHLFLNFISKQGQIKRAAIREYANINRSGILAVKVKEDDRIIAVLPSKGIDDVLLVTHLGQSIRFSELEVRISGRISGGVAGMKLDSKDYVVGGIIVPMKYDSDGYTITNDPALTMMTFTTKGFGKRTNVDEYLVSPTDGGKLRQQSRAGKGRIDINLESKTGKSIGVMPLKDDKDVIIITKLGQMVRIPSNSIRTTYRGTSGVRIVKLGDGDEVVAASPTAQEPNETETNLV